MNQKVSLFSNIQSIFVITLPLLNFDVPIKTVVFSNFLTKISLQILLNLHTGPNKCPPSFLPKRVKNYLLLSLNHNYTFMITITMFNVQYNHKNTVSKILARCSLPKRLNHELFKHNFNFNQYN